MTLNRTDAIVKASQEAQNFRHPQRLMRVSLECGHARLLPWNVTGTGVGSYTLCSVCPDRPERLAVNIEETGVLSDQGARRAAEGR